MKYELVSTYQDVLNNANVFNQGVRFSLDIFRKLGTFRHWYYFDEFDSFAPSKFVGYKDNTMEKYEVGHSTGMDGRETVPVLKKWFKEVDDSDFDLYYKKLQILLSEYDRKPNKKLYLYIKK